MPYTVRNAPVRRVLSRVPRALRIWVDVFNRVHRETGDDDRARIAAWSAVRRAGYCKGPDGYWRRCRR